MTTLPAVEAAAQCVKRTRDAVLLSKTSFTSIAKACGKDRGTVSRTLDERDDMPLSMFLAAQTQAGKDPLQTLADAYAENTVPEFAESEVA